MEPLISVIIPVYNTGSYLSPGLESLIAQTHRNIEVILVDDGSSDGSGELCDEFARRDDRITVIHQQNAGVSAARNAGLEQATGEYLFFLDSDDRLPPDSLAVLCEPMSTGTLVCGSMRQIGADGISSEDGLFLKEQHFSAEHMLHLLFHEEEQGYQGFLCNKLFDNQIIRCCTLRFHPDVRYNEDRLFITEYLLQCREVFFREAVVYCYRQHGSSALGQLQHTFKPAMLTELDAFERMYDLLRDTHPLLALRVARLCFEKSLYWLGHIPRERREDRTRTRRLLRSNAKRCLKDPDSSPMTKLKVVVHCLLEH